MKKRNIKICIIVGSLIVCFPIACFSGSLFYFWYHETHTGSFSGRVIDAVTSEPIEGAVVTYAWRFEGVLAKSWAASYEILTDKEGKYFIPNQRIKRDTIFRGSLEPEAVLIYKNNYAVYRLWREYGKPTVGRSWGYRLKNQLYYRKNNLVKLYPWEKGESHEDHYYSITHSPGWGGGNHSLLTEELQEEEKRADKESLEKYR